MNYIEVLNNEKIIEIYNEIEKINPWSFSHGIKHINNVLKHIIKITDMLELSDEDKRDLLIATVLHDTGRLFGSEDHARASKAFIEEFLKGRANESSINKIINIVSNHRIDENNDDKDILSKLLIFCDKMDFSKERLVKNYKEISPNTLYAGIDKVDFNISDNTLVIEVYGLENDEIYRLENHIFYTKNILKATQILSVSLNKRYSIKYI